MALPKLTLGIEEEYQIIDPRDAGAGQSTRSSC